jgi:hypothetical protein
VQTNQKRADTLGINPEQTTMALFLSEEYDGLHIGSLPKPAPAPAPVSGQLPIAQVRAFNALLMRAVRS